MGNNTLKLSQACEGMLRYKAATGKSPHTIVDYRSSFKKLQLFYERATHFGNNHSPAAHWTQGYIGGVHTKGLGKAVLSFYNCTSH